MFLHLGQSQLLYEHSIWFLLFSVLGIEQFTSLILETGF